MTSGRSTRNQEWCRSDGYQVSEQFSRASLERPGAVVSAADYGPRGHWFETWPGRRSLWPGASHISKAQVVYMYICSCLNIIQSLC